MERSEQLYPNSKAPARAGAFLSVYAPTPDNVSFLSGVLRRGELVAVPSETVYGLAAMATNPEACARIFALKQRPFFDPLIVHVRSAHQARRYARFDSIAEHLAQTFWPGPLTMVLPREASIPDIVTAGLTTVAVRCPQHSVFQALLDEVDEGLAAPSANPFGYISPTTAAHVEASFGASLPYILDGGPCPIGLESTIVDASNPAALVILRSGQIGLRELKRALGKLSRPPSIEHRRANAEEQTGSQPAPGLSPRHYSPRTDLRLFPHGAMPEPAAEPTIAHLFFQRPAGHIRPNTFSLSAAGDGAEAAARLYAQLRILDQQSWNAIFVERPPRGAHLFDALSDRLQRAAAR